MLFFVPTAVLAESADFLSPKIDNVSRSLVCPQDDDCYSLFLIKGNNFVNSNGVEAVKVGDEWAEILRWSDDYIAATASEEAYDKTPTVAIDATLHRPVLNSGDEVLDAMFADSVEVALESIKVYEDGTRYIVAGPKYTNPERTYYRDSYWTIGMIMMIEPSVIRDQILLLARGVNFDGSVPSAIPVNPEDAMIPLWINHHDSGPYLVMMVYDYIRWTGDEAILDEVVNGRSVFTILEDTVSYLSTQDSDGNYLPEKPDNSLQDWLDSIPRSGEVFYNQVLYYRALRNLVELANLVGEPTHATAFHRQSILVRYMVNKQFWNEEGGYYYERCENGVCDDRITNESSLALLYDVVDYANRDRFMDSLKQLQTNVNDDIPYGDWGVLNAWPLYDGFTPHDYHNGTDWPFLDGMNAGARLRLGNEDWRYPLVRWYEFNKAHWADRMLPEYVSPVDQDAGEWQAWSVNPAAMFVVYGLGIDPNLDGEYAPKQSPAGDTRIENIVVRGERISVDAPAL